MDQSEKKIATMICDFAFYNCGKQFYSHKTGTNWKWVPKPTDQLDDPRASLLLTIIKNGVFCNTIYSSWM